MNEPGYRLCVGVMLVNSAGKVFVAKRVDTRVMLDQIDGLDADEYWQMPQGGVDQGEDVEAAAQRELTEETGLSNSSIALVERISAPLRYDFPEKLIGRLWKGQYRGQEQVWFLARFTGADSEIDLNADESPEFSDWKWLDPEDLPDVVVPFKQSVYRAVLEEFHDLI